MINAEIFIYVDKQLKWELGIWRIMRNRGKKDRVILETYQYIETIPNEMELVKTWPPDNYWEGQIIATLSNCELNRSWIPEVVPLNADRQQVVKFYFEIECEVHWTDDQI